MRKAANAKPAKPLQSESAPSAASSAPLQHEIGNVDDATDTVLDDGASSGSDCAPGHVEERDDHIRHLLFADWDWDEQSDTSELGEDDKADFSQLEDLNDEVAVACANVCAAEDEQVLANIADRVQNRCDNSLFQGSVASLPNVEQQQEALLQEVLSGGLARQSPGDIGGENAEADAIVTETIVNEFLDGLSKPTEDAFFNAWEVGVAQAVEALVHRQKNKDQPISKELTLLLQVQNEAADVVLVQWSSSRLNEGRAIQLDEDNKIVCPVNFVQRSSVFDLRNEDIHVILPSVGEMVRRVKKSERPPLPEHALKLRQIFKQAIASHSQEADRSLVFDDNDTESSNTVCAICNSSSTGSGHNEIRSCALCGLAAHAKCNEILSSVSTDARVTGSAGLIEARARCCMTLFPRILLSSVQSEEQVAQSHSQSPWHTSLDSG